MGVMKYIIGKLLSGRYILTVIGGVVFLWCAIHKQLEAATIKAILLSIFNSYFQKKRDGGNGVDK
jgi:hypothetical protein